MQTSLFRLGPIIASPDFLTTVPSLKGHAQHTGPARSMASRFGRRAAGRTPGSQLEHQARDVLEFLLRFRSGAGPAGRAGSRSCRVQKANDRQKAPMSRGKKCRE